MKPQHKITLKILKFEFLFENYKKYWDIFTAAKFQLVNLMFYDRRISNSSITG